MGLSISSAISIFVNKVVNVWGIPYSFNIAKKNRKLGIANGKYNIDYKEFDRLDMPEGVYEKFNAVEKVICQKMRY